MVKCYFVYDRKKVQKKGLDKGFLRQFHKKKHAKIFASNSPDDYIIKKGKC